MGEAADMSRNRQILRLCCRGKRTAVACHRMSRSIPVMALALLAVTSVFIISFTIPGYKTTLITFGSSMTDSEGECQKQRTNILFLKLHKCASSTVQNILMRYGEKNWLDFVLPEKGNYLGSPRPFVPQLVGKTVRTASGKYNIFAHHTRYNASGMHEVMYPDAAFVTIMRDPVRLFESLYSYYGMAGFLRMPLQQFIRLPLTQVRQVPRLSGKIGVNQMAWDFGIEAFGFYNENLMRSLIHHVESHFDLVMISEYMEVSLVLLKDLMCWSLDDVTFFTLNARSASAHANLTDWEQRRIAELNGADAMLYQHFLRRFRERVREFGEQRMRREVEALMRRNAELYSRCVKAVLPPVNPGGAYSDMRYLLRSDLGELEPMCRLITIPELEFTAQLRDQQVKKMRVFAQLDRLFAELDDESRTITTVADS